MEDIIAFIVGAVIVLLGIYGMCLDIFHGHWMWTLLDILTSGGIAVIRGFGYFFGFISY